MSVAPVLLWFRQDLRLDDHRALSAAIATGQPVIPVYVLDDDTPGLWRLGGASRWWLHSSLETLTKDLNALGSRLILRRGPGHDVLMALIKETGASGVHVSRSYEPWASGLEKSVAEHCAAVNVAFHRFAGALLFEPEALRTKAGDPFKVFTPFHKACLELTPPKPPLVRPASISAPKHWPESDELADWGLLPTRPDWAGGLRATWEPGEAAAKRRLATFLDGAIAGYGDGRDRPGKEGTSRLSPHLHFGEISPHRCWQAVQDSMTGSRKAGGGRAFLRELIWREFCHHLLSHWPDLPRKAFRPEFEAFPWSSGKKGLKAWQQGRTGYPIVDAGMRQLWQTGWMHNRVRMVVASFLIKDLLIPWQDGEAWFWDTLVDADLANNAANWQWVAGSGADAAPYFRIYNPILQARKFDPEGDYVRRYVPEIAKLDDDHLHTPWEAPAPALEAAGIELGKTYPRPIVDHAEARERALQAYGQVKQG